MTMPDQAPRGAREVPRCPKCTFATAQRRAKGGCPYCKFTQNNSQAPQTLKQALSQTIQITRIGRATDPKPEDKIWFTTQMQDLFVLDTTATEAALTTLIETVIGEDLDQVPEEYHEEHFVIQAVNHHKAEQRKRLKELL